MTNDDLVLFFRLQFSMNTSLDQDHGQEDAAHAEHSAPESHHSTKNCLENQIKQQIVILKLILPLFLCCQEMFQF